MQKKDSISMIAIIGIPELVIAVIMETMVQTLTELRGRGLVEKTQSPLGLIEELRKADVVDSAVRGAIRFGIEQGVLNDDLSGPH